MTIPSCEPASSTWTSSTLVCRDTTSPLLFHPTPPNHFTLLVWHWTDGPKLSFSVSFVQKHLTRSYEAQRLAQKLLHAVHLLSPTPWHLPPKSLILVFHEALVGKSTSPWLTLRSKQAVRPWTLFFPDSWEALFNEIFFCWRMRASILSFFKREGKENLYLGTWPSQPLSHLLFFFFFLRQCIIVLMGLIG